MTSPGSGFYKYHCRYFNVHNCPEWAKGRENELSPAAAWAASRDFMAPHINDGILQYAHMDIAVSEQGEESFIMRSETLHPPPPAIPVTTMMPGGKTLLATTH
ncbi:hypothetical protein BM221_001825 [Beauveria bassiana]|uniref:Uncharacterized protein n=1 Tax=Beauveria bassiana TaxID=176275 RepID=A0A2N6NWS8_BEABA|nr:hypothetical protein BM221_001825 [Beauveria bassiana]